MEALQKKTRQLIMVMVITALVITPLVLLGVFLGEYVGGVTGYSKPIMGIAFSTAGFLAGIAIIVKVITFMVKGSSGPKP